MRGASGTALGLQWLLAPFVVIGCSAASEVWWGPVAAPKEWRLDPVPAVMPFEYDGELLISAFGGSSRYRYDDRELLVEERSGELVKTYTYDDEERLVTVWHEVDGVGTTQELYGYDAEGRLVDWRIDRWMVEPVLRFTVGWVTEERETRSYGPTGALESLISEGLDRAPFRLTFERDDAGRIVQELVGQLDSEGWWSSPSLGISFARDYEGRIIKRYSGRTVYEAFEYDEEGQIILVDLTIGRPDRGVFPIARDPSLDARFWVGPWNVRDDRPGGYRSLFAGDH